MKELIIFIAIVILLVKFGSSAHYIVGNVENAPDGEPANTKTVLLWNEINGALDNETDIIGPTGNSGVNNLFMIDCELLTIPCDIGDNMSIRVLNLDGYFSETKNVTVTGAGFDLADNLTLNSPLNITSVTIEDDLSVPLNQIDLLPATTKNVTCSGIIKDFEGEGEILNATARLFHESVGYSDADDNNTHYTNNSCTLNTTYGDSTEASFNCTFKLQYYSNPGNWNCTVEAYDNNSNNDLEYDMTVVNELLALGVNSIINFGSIEPGNLTEEKQANVTNYGNVMFNLSLSAYGATPDDGLAMDCSSANITIENQKFNQTNSYPGLMNLSTVFNNYTNLSTGVTITNFNLDFRTNDAVNDANKSTYWRIYASSDINGICSGNTVFGAVKAPAS